MKPVLCISAVLLASGVTFAGDAAVNLVKKSDTVEVTIGGEPFAVYNFSRDLPKPFFSPVRGPDGTVLTRPIERKGDDHPHHKGIWLAVDEINGIKYWAEDGKIENSSVKVLSEGNPAKLKVVNRWLGEDGKPVLTESTLISIFPNRLMAYDIRLEAKRNTVSFEDTKEGLFGFRMVDSMRERDGGKVVGADGLKGSNECWGRTSNWVDYYGPVEGNTFGVTLMDHPENFRKSRYHVRNYGLFSISPFGEKAYTRGENDAAPVHLERGETLRLRYGLYIHAGDTDSAKVPQVYGQFLKAVK